jgi:hypothetical protein
MSNWKVWVIGAAALLALTGCSHEREDMEAWCHGGGAVVMKVCENECAGKYPSTRYACVIEIHQGVQR